MKHSTKLLTAFALAVVTASMFVLSGCLFPMMPSTAPKVDGDTASPSGSAESGKKPTEAPTEEPAETFKFGETALINNFEITVVGYSIEDKIYTGKYTYYEPDEGNRYLCFDVHIKNVDTERQAFIPSFSLTEEITPRVKYGEYTYSMSQFYGYDKDFHDEVYQPLQTADGVFVFSIPETVLNAAGENLEGLNLVISYGRVKAVYGLSE